MELRIIKMLSHLISVEDGLKSVELVVLQRFHVNPWAAFLGAHAEHLLCGGAESDLRSSKNGGCRKERPSDDVIPTDKAR